MLEPHRKLSHDAQPPHLRIFSLIDTAISASRRRARPSTIANHGFQTRRIGSSTENNTSTFSYSVQILPLAPRRRQRRPPSGPTMAVWHHTSRSRLVLRPVDKQIEPLSIPQPPQSFPCSTAAVFKRHHQRRPQTQRNHLDRRPNPTPSTHPLKTPETR